MTTSLISVDDLLATFQPVNKIIGRPDYNSLNTLRTTLKQNAASITTTEGGGQHGYLALLVSPQVYATISATAFAPPQNPGPYPTIGANDTQAQIGAATRTHAEQSRLYQQYNYMQQALKKQITDAIDAIFLTALKQPHIGLANRTAYELLQHLFSNYAVIHPTELTNNENNMKKPWNPAEPFEVIIEQIDTAVEFATDGNAPIPATTILNTAYSLVFNSGVYNHDLLEWDNKPAANRADWTQFKNFMLQKQLLRNRRPLLPAPGHAMMGHNFPPPELYQMHMPPPPGYYGHMFPPMPPFYAPAPPPEQPPQQQAQEPPPTDNTENNPPTGVAAATMESKLAELTALVEKLTAEKNKPREARGPRKKPDPNGYCWTHGYIVAHGHNSRTCNAKQEGHQDAATRSNTMGGSDKNKDKKI